MNNFKYTLDNKRYHTYNYFLKNKYHGKVAKVALNGHFTCPNRDGLVGYGGCIFCSSSGSGDFAGDPGDDLYTQFDSVSRVMKNKWPDCKYIAYFQANTNTYGSIEKLRSTFELFVGYPDVVGIAIATRPDCLSDEVVNYLKELSKKTDLYVELGLQTIHDKTGELINRGHDFNTFVEGLDKLRRKNIDVCVHIINGLPYETHDMMLETAKVLGRLDIQGLKIHNLYILKNTPLYSMYKEKPFKMLSREEYIELVVEQLRYIPDQVVIERLTGDAPISELVEPRWSIKKVTILNDIDKLMKKKNLYQGDQFTPL